MELMLENVNAVELLTAAGVLLNSYWLYRLNSKFDAYPPGAGADTR